MKLKVEVKQNDIKQGERGQSLLCAVARAINRALKGNEDELELVGVGNLSVEFTHSTGEFLGRFHCVDLPLKARKFVNAFDEGPKSKLKPIKFTLDIPLK